MGAWGPGVFSDDLADDVRGEWREAIIAGADAEATTRELIRRYASADDDDPQETVFWVALAAAQMQTGRLEPHVRDRALALIDAGGDLDLWEESGMRAARKRVLDRLAKRLRGPQAAPKRLRGPRPGPDPGVRAGDVVRIYNAERSRSALFAVTALTEYRRERWPVLLGLYWDGGEVPDARGLAALPYLSWAERGPVERDPHAIIAAPYVVTVIVSRPGDELRPEVGEVVAHGVSRPECFGSHSMSGWEHIVHTLGDEGCFDACLATTRERLSRYGDDPSAREQELQRVSAEAEVAARAFMRLVNLDPD